MCARGEGGPRAPPVPPPSSAEGRSRVEGRGSRVGGARAPRPVVALVAGRSRSPCTARARPPLARLGSRGAAAGPPAASRLPGRVGSARSLSGGVGAVRAPCSRGGAPPPAVSRRPPWTVLSLGPSGVSLWPLPLARSAPLPVSGSPFGPLGPGPGSLPSPPPLPSPCPDTACPARLRPASRRSFPRVLRGRGGAWVAGAGTARVLGKVGGFGVFGGSGRGPCPAPTALRGGVRVVEERPVSGLPGGGPVVAPGGQVVAGETQLPPSRAGRRLGFFAACGVWPSGPGSASRSRRWPVAAPPPPEASPVTLPPSQNTPLSRYLARPGAEV